MRKFLLFVPLLLPCTPQAALVPPNPAPNTGRGSEPERIRVRLAEATPLAQVEGFDLKIKAIEMDGNTKENIRSLSAGRATRWEFRCQRDRVRAIQVGGAGALDLPSPVSVTTPAVFFQYQGRPYREELRIFATGSLCEVVNVVDIEKYLDGLVNAEFSSRWNDEAVEAQVVAARSYAVYQMRKAKALRYDVDSTVKDQVYDGSIKEDPRSSRLVAKTRGLVLAAQDPKGGLVPIKAFYHSTCAGKTALPQSVWGTTYPGFRRTVSCPFCASSPAIRWELDLPAQSVEEKFRIGALAEAGMAKARNWPKNWGAILERGHLVAMRVHGWDEQGRVGELTAEWEADGGRTKIKLGVPGARFRDWMGAWRFRSAAFDISLDRRGGAWHFSGRGYGHGVGMCQYGAKVMGERGYRMSNILKHYYPDAVLRRLW